MSFQTDELTMLALGILNDAPVDPDQPPLANGIHLCWDFRQEKGFPLHGFYLFRREHRPRGPVCLRPHLEGLRPGSPRGAMLDTRLGRLGSAHPLVWTDDFAPGGTIEADARKGLRFELPAGVEAGSVEVRIGLRDPGDRLVRTCIDFRRFDLGTGPSPRTEKGVVFDVEPPPISPPISETSIEAWSGGPRGLVVSRRTAVDLPCAARKVDLLLTNRAALRIQALDAGGKVLATRDLQRGELAAGKVTLDGAAITQVVFETPATDAGLLHEICFDCLVPGAGEAEIEVLALAGTGIVRRKTVRGAAGQIVSATLAAEGITAVEIPPGPAALVDLCYVPTRQGVTFGWEAVPDLQVPLCLPVAHEDYPCPGRPATFGEAETLALSRVAYGDPAEWKDGFAGLHDQLARLVEGGPNGPPMAQRTNPTLPGVPLSPATQDPLPSLPGLRPLDLVLLAGLHPAVAQMVGLYAVDRSAEPGVGYDYLLLADPSGVLGGTAASALDWLAFHADPSEVDAVLVLDRKAAARLPIAPPGAPQAYALPAMVTRKMDGGLREGTGSVGLWWPLPAEPADEEEELDRILFHFPKRASLGAVEPAAQPALSEYEAIPELPPVLVSEPDVPVVPGPPGSDWPQPSIPLHLIDGNLPEGWYSYRLWGRDRFGRHSPLGPPSEWYQWDPPPNTPAPWYYKPPAGHRPIHSFAVALLDKMPPPVPLGVEAWALDPLDRWVLVDGPYETWREDNEDLVGLRVRWRWTLLQQIQALDTREFRIYYQPGRWNALLGKTVKVAAASASESDVELDFASSHPPDEFAGTRLRVGNSDFKVLGSQPGAKLRLRVKNIGVHDEVRPAEGKPCTVAIPEKHALWVDTGLAKTWAKRLAHVDYDPPARIVVDPSKDADGRLLTDEAFKQEGLGTTVTVTGTTANLPLESNLSGIQPWIDHLWLEDGSGVSETHRIVRYDAKWRTLTLETAPTLGPPVHWIVGRPAREYDVFLPAPDVGAGHPFEPSLAEPTVFAQIAVSAADDKTHVSDDPKWNDPGRFGNESRLSPSATVYRVLQTPPQAPGLPKLPGRLYATPADYHSRSYSTFRFLQTEHLRVHILRALDDSLFQRDWIIRETRKALDPANPDHADFFPDTMDQATRKAAATALKAISADTAYANLTQDAWAVLALLPGNEGAAGKEEIFKNKALRERDWLIRRTRTALSATDDTDLFPKDWDPPTRGAAATALNQLNAPGGYLELEDGALRILAGLPGNEAAFTQATLQPLEMADIWIRDERRPDDEANYKEDPDIRAYTDTLAGNATNRYFYRASFVDGAQNQSALSLAGPPVYLHDVEPPRVPVITTVAGGDGTIDLTWAHNRESDLLEYRVYRSDTEKSASDIRFMTVVETIPAVPADDTDRAPEILWRDAGVVRGRSYWYRIVAVDTSGNISAPTAPVAGKAFRLSPVPPPEWIDASWRPSNDAIELQWEPSESGLSHLVQRRASTTLRWESVSHWLDLDTASFVDESAIPGEEYFYRIRARDGSGNASSAFVSRRVPAPE